MRDLLAQKLDREVKDPRVRAAGLASVNHVELNRDMSVARVFVSFIGPADGNEQIRDRAMAGLRGAAGFLRGPVARQLRLRHAPELRFIYDDSPAFSQRIGELVRDEESSRQGPEGLASHGESGPGDSAGDPADEDSLADGGGDEE